MRHRPPAGGELNTLLFFSFFRTTRFHHIMARVTNMLAGGRPGRIMPGKPQLTRYRPTFLGTLRLRLHILIPGHGLIGI
jgi:hypothetical protein